MNRISSWQLFSGPQTKKWWHTLHPIDEHKTHPSPNGRAVYRFVTKSSTHLISNSPTLSNIWFQTHRVWSGIREREARYSLDCVLVDLWGTVQCRPFAELRHWASRMRLLFDVNVLAVVGLPFSKSYCCIHWFGCFNFINESHESFCSPFWSVFSEGVCLGIFSIHITRF